MAGSLDPRELIEFLNQRDRQRTPRRRHRLAPEVYAASDCEFFFTLCARQHGTPFADPELAQEVVEALLWRRLHCQWRLFGYCLMPDHLHFVVRLPDTDAPHRNHGARGSGPVGILEQARDFKKFTTTHLWRPRSGAGPLWQRSSYDRIIRRNDTVDAAVQYLLENPVRKGLVSCWEAYPYSGIPDDWRGYFSEDPLP